VPASAPANRAAVRATWQVGSTQLQSAAIIALIAGGILLIGGGWAAVISARRGPSAPVWQ